MTNKPDGFGLWLVYVVASVLLVAMLAGYLEYLFRVVDAFREADPAVTLEQVWETLTCAPECAREW